MASIKQALAGSPFQFRNIRQHLLPPFEDVKIAKFKWNPHSMKQNSGFLRTAANMFEGRVTQRLCPKTEFSHEVIPEHETPRLEFEYMTGETATFPMDKYKTTRELLVDLKEHRQHLKVLRIWRDTSIVAGKEMSADPEQSGGGSGGKSKKKK